MQLMCSWSCTTAAPASFQSIFLLWEPRCPWAVTFLGSAGLSATAAVLAFCRDIHPSRCVLKINWDVCLRYHHRPMLYSCEDGMLSQLGHSQRVSSLHRALALCVKRISGWRGQAPLVCVVRLTLASLLDHLLKSKYKLGFCLVDF